MIIMQCNVYIICQQEPESAGASFPAADVREQERAQA